jgi:hypothetical protein
LVFFSRPVTPGAGTQRLLARHPEGWGPGGPRCAPAARAHTPPSLSSFPRVPAAWPGCWEGNPTPGLPRVAPHPECVDTPPGSDGLFRKLGAIAFFLGIKGEYPWMRKQGCCSMKGGVRNRGASKGQQPLPVSPRPQPLLNTNASQMSSFNFTEYYRTAFRGVSGSQDGALVLDSYNIRA